MAVLEKIRSKSVLLFTIIIVALLAFILGDFFNSGRSFFGPGDTVAKANGAKVNIAEYNKLSQQLKEQNKGANSDMLDEQAIQQLLFEGLLNNEYDRLGITVTDKELSQFMLDPKASPMVMQMFCNSLGIQPQMLMQMGFATSANLLDAVKNPAKYKLNPDDAQAFKTAWQETENEVEKQIKQYAYSRMLSSLFVANNLDAKQLYDANNTTVTYAYVAKEYTSTPDDKVKLTDADYKAYYDAHLSQFKLQEDSRYVHYIAVPMAPSATDIEAVNNEMQALVAELDTISGGVDNVNKAVRNHKNFEFQSAKVTRGQLAQMQNTPFQSLSFTIDSMAVGKARMLPNMGNSYSAVKLVSRSTGIDTVKFTLYPVEKPDSLQAQLAKVNVANIDSLARMINPQLVDQTQSLVGADTVGLAQRLLTAPLNSIFTYTDTVTAQDGTPNPVAYIVNVKHRSAPVAVYELAVAGYQLLPSVETEKQLVEKLNKYVGTNGNAEAFNKNAAKAGYMVQSALVGPSNPLGNNAPNSLTALKWVMDADKGQVSKVYTLSLPQNEQNPGVSQYLLAVAVDEVFDDDYIPATSAFVKDTFKPAVLDLKKAQMVIDQYKGKAKTIEEAAKLFGTEVATANGAFGMNNNSPELLAALATAKPGTLVGPVKGFGQVYFIKVNESKAQGRPYDYKENAANFMQNNFAATSSMQGMLQMLIGDNRIKNNILEFIPGEDK